MGHAVKNICVFQTMGGDPLMSHEINLVDFEKPFKNEIEETISEASWSKGK